MCAKNCQTGLKGATDWGTDTGSAMIMWIFDSKLPTQVFWVNNQTVVAARLGGLGVANASDTQTLVYNFIGGCGPTFDVIKTPFWETWDFQCPPLHPVLWSHKAQEYCADSKIKFRIVCLFMRTDCQPVEEGGWLCGQWEGRGADHRPIRSRAYLTAGLTIDSPAGCGILLANFPTQLKCKIYVIKNIYSHEFNSDQQGRPDKIGQSDTSMGSVWPMRGQ